MTYVTDQTSAEIRAHMRMLKALPGWNDPLSDRLFKEIQALDAQRKELLGDLREAAATLRRYEVLHRAKGTAESDAKAEVNAALAARFEATIAKATE